MNITLTAEQQAQCREYARKRQQVVKDANKRPEPGWSGNRSEDPMDRELHGIGAECLAIPEIVSAHRRLSQAL